MVLMKTFNKFSLLILSIVIGLLILNSPSKQLMPELDFVDIDGQSHQLADYKGKPILIIFWSTDCPGCIAEMPELIKLYQDYSPRGLTMIGIALQHDSIQHIQAMRQQRQIPYLLTWDKTGDMAQQFNRVRVTPTHFLINAEGEIVLRKIGELDINKLKEKLRTLGL